MLGTRHVQASGAILGEAAHRAEVPTSRMQSRYCVVSMSDKTYIPT